MKYFKLAEKKGKSETQRLLGECYYFGRGVAEDYQKAAQWYTKSAEQGIAEAQYQLGSCYDMGEGVPEDPKMAVKWYTKEQIYAGKDNWRTRLVGQNFDAYFAGQRYSLELIKSIHP